MTAVLIVIYLSFISLGLPDSLLGAAWPIMHIILEVPTTYAGILSFTTSICTVISALSAMWLNKKLGTGKTIAISTLMTSFALFSYSIFPSFWMLIPISIVLGLGAGAIDSALNNYVALNYESKHMSLLHAFWGLGAVLGPFILSFGLSKNNYQLGYRIIAIIQFTLAIVQFKYIKLFDKTEKNTLNKDQLGEVNNVIQGTSKKWTVILACLAFFLYCAIENSLFIWISTYYVNNLGANEVLGARATSIFFIGITGGRLLSSFVSDKVGVKKMIFIGSSLAVIGGIGLLFARSTSSSLIWTVIVGLAFAPLFPSMLHRTPRRFGSINSPSIIGKQMASAYVGASLAPPLFGYLMIKYSYKLLPIIIIIFSSLIIIATYVIENSGNKIQSPELVIK